MLKRVVLGGVALGGAALAVSRAKAARADERPRHLSETIEAYEHARTRIMVLGAGFAGVAATLELDRRLRGHMDTSILLVDRGNTQLFTPLLWTVADGRANPNDVMVPIRSFQRGRSFHVLHAGVEEIDLDTKEVRTTAGPRPYDHLVIALGSQTSVPPVPGLREQVLLFHSTADALQLRNHVINALEEAHQCEDPEERQAWLTFVVGGGGDTGTELAATIHDYVASGLLAQYPWLTGTPARVVIVEQEDRLMPLSKKEVSEVVMRLITAEGVDLHLGAKVERVTDDRVYTSKGEIPARTVFWAAGTTAPEVVKKLPVKHERNGALTVDDNLRVPAHEEVCVVGDSAWICDAQTGDPVPPTAQAAEQEGRYVARVITDKVLGVQDAVPPFHFSSRGHLTLLAGHKAVGEIGSVTLSGLPAWLLWHGYYLSHLPLWRNRVRLATDWLLSGIIGRETGQLRLGMNTPPREQGEAR